MFSGIVECQTAVLEFKNRGQVREIQVQAPQEWKDVATGDSIAVNGVCLTVTKVTNDALYFDAALETLKVTGWNEELVGKSVNVERSLRFGDRVHGHLVTGHVDEITEVISLETAGDALLIAVVVPPSLRTLVWKKGSIALNGVSLTVNEMTTEGVAEFCLIPETLRRTNLGQLEIGEKVMMEVDNMARGLLRLREAQP